MIYQNHEYSLLNKNGRRKYLNRAERESFLRAINVLEIEKRLFVLIIYWTGVRLGEALAIYPRHIDFFKGVLIIKSLKKRGRVIHRQIPLPPFILNSLKQNVSHKIAEKPIWMFSRRTGCRYIKKVMLSANIEGPQACARGLRHSFAVNCVINHIPLSLLQKWMGHSSILITAIYTQIMGDDEIQLAARTWQD